MIVSIKYHENHGSLRVWMDKEYNTDCYSAAIGMAFREMNEKGRTVVDIRLKEESGESKQSA